jgi:rubrerythrin
LTKEEKEFFYQAVNKLSREVYKRGETNSGLFLKAIEDGNAEEAFLLIQSLSWRYPAINILREVKRINKLSDDKSKELQLEKLCKFAHTYGIKESLPSIVLCDECGEVMTTLDMVCPSCGKLVDE